MLDVDFEMVKTNDYIPLLGTMQTATDAVTEHRPPKAQGLESN
jgi:hypothetical protein